MQIFRPSDNVRSWIALCAFAGVYPGVDTGTHIAETHWVFWVNAPENFQNTH